ncbi:MAG: Protein-N(5)-glutamine methyltransferase PrmC, partial [Myxococcaceae bacterium]|nr:Protein-N(5)-glutamine methyltransferase PrmC [Myxococcaceae bacterium]
MFALLAIAPLLLGVPTEPSWNVVPTPDGHIALAQGVLSGPSAGDLREAARAFVLSHRAELGLPITSSLGPAQTFATRFGGSVHLPQLVDGLEVYGGKVIVTFDLQGRVVRVASSLRSYDRVKLSWSLTGPQALLAGARQIEGAVFQNGGVPYGGYQQKMFPVGDELHAGYFVWVPTWKTSQNWHLAIDATDGTVLWSEDRVRHGFEANVYASSPGGLSTGVGVTPLAPVTLDHFPAGVDGGKLSGELIRAFNCCPTANCNLDAGAPARRATGMFQTFGGTVSYDLAICDRYQRATNDPAVNPNGNYLYAPTDVPTGAGPNPQSPADFDEFAEVHAYFHVNKVYDYLRALSIGPLTADAGFSAFAMRDSKLGKVPAIQVNASEPAFPQSPNAQGVYVSNTMTRVENAMFLARENMQAVTVPEFAFDTDALVIYQGDKADFAYDAPVVWHEFGHGAIYSTSNWNRGVEIDARSSNDESSALHEGVADVIAFMVGQESAIGQYVGPRTDFGSAALRNANNTDKCPDVLWGESHQDSQHFAGAIWQARATAFQGTDQGRTFDAAFYAALVSFPPNVGFEKAAAIISSAVGLAFPALPLAQAQMKQIFDARGVSSCSKVLDVTSIPSPRKVYIISGSAYAALGSGQGVPGPYQMKIRVPKGAKSVTLSGPYFSGGGSTTARLALLAKANQPITFTRAGQTLTHDADKSVVPTAGGGTMSGTALIDVPCGGELYFRPGLLVRRGRQLRGHPRRGHGDRRRHRRPRCGHAAAARRRDSSPGERHRRDLPDAPGRGGADGLRLLRGGCRAVVAGAARRAAAATSRAPSAVSAIDPEVRFSDGGVELLWRSESGAPPPAKLARVGDRLNAQAALKRVKNEHLLYEGDFRNARQLLAAMGRKLGGGRRPENRSALEEFRAERAARLREHETLSRIVVKLDPKYRLAQLKNAPDVAEACTAVWGPAALPTVVPLKALIGMLGAAEWYRKGLAVRGLPGKLHPHYGVFLPTRSEYVDLLLEAPPPEGKRVFDLGTGTGVLSFLLLQRGATHAIGTDVDPRAVACAIENAQRLGLAGRFEAREESLFPPGRADLVVANPPWIPEPPKNRLDRAVFDENSAFLDGFLAGLAGHLGPGGEGWLLMSNLAELLGLRAPGSLAARFDAAGLQVSWTKSTQAQHP